MSVTNKLGLRVIAAVLALAMLAACSKAEDGEAGAGQSTGGGAEVDADLGEDLMWDDGPCDDSQPTVPLGLIAPFNAGSISLEDQAIAAEVSAEAFNERGGIAGRCIEMITCDDGGDPNQAAECARDLVADGVVADVNDAVISSADVVVDTFLQAGVPRLDGNPAPVAFSAANTYAFGMGGLGNAVMMVPPLVEQGRSRFAIVRADVPGAAALQTIIEPMVTAYGGEVVADIPVTVGTSDFSQFVLAADAAGADGVLMLAGREEVIQVLRAAQQLDSDLGYSLSLGSVSQQDVAEFGDFADQLVFNGELPASSVDPEPYPLLAVATRELAASGEERLQPDTMTNASLKSWVYMYALVKMVRDAGITDITPASVTEVLNAATDVDMGDLTPPWTPNATSDGIFERVSQPYYWTATWDGEADNFLMGEQLDSVALLAGDVS
jgi:ABC-type branched-subunit amino acid transport system substrate-binding protein